MKPSKLKPNDLIEVLWHDAHDAGCAGKQWMGREEVGGKTFDYECLSVGYLIKTDQDMIYIAGDIGGEQISRPFGIPRGCIKIIRRLREI